jgi:hypothetical protein
MAEIRNGRLVDVPDSGLYGEDLVNAINPGQGRRAVVGSGIKVETINPNKHYSKSELTGRGGKPVMVKQMPDRTKG